MQKTALRFSPRKTFAIAVNRLILAAISLNELDAEVLIVSRFQVLCSFVGMGSPIISPSQLAYYAHLHGDQMSQANT